MGFPSKPSVYPLSGFQLVYALASNPYFIPGRYGTLLAFGSVTEPFMDISFPRALEYFKALRDLLGNPQQVSTKSSFGEDLVDSLVSAVDPELDVLVTVVTLRYWRKLEPGAPSPEERLETAGRLARRGLHVTLFMRPIIPGVTNVEARSILELALSYGVRDVVLGTLRVTPRITARLRSTGVVSVDEIERRLPKPLHNPRMQIPIRGSDLKKAVEREAERLGFRVHPASCSSNIASHRQACAACHLGPCGNLDRLPEVSEDGVRGALKALGIKFEGVGVKGYEVFVKCVDSRGKCRRLKHFIVALARRKPVVVGTFREPVLTGGLA
jgi:DNA repair photolyase